MFFDPTSLDAMDFRMPVKGMSVNADAGAAAAAEGADPGALNFSTSAFVIRPPSPVPLTCFRGMPFSRAYFLANGEALIVSLSSTVSSGFPLLTVSCAEEAFAGVGAGFDGAGASSASSFGAGALFAPPASAIVKSANAEISSPSST